MHSLHSPGNAMILERDAKAVGLLHTDKTTKHFLNEINMERLQQDAELNIYTIFFVMFSTGERSVARFLSKQRILIRTNTGTDTLRYCVDIKVV